MVLVVLPFRISCIVDAPCQVPVEAFVEAQFRRPDVSLQDAHSQFPLVRKL
jgi:hypothetical protein